MITTGSTTTITYTPNENFNGSDTFSYTVSDGADLVLRDIEMVTVTVNAVDDYAFTNEVTEVDTNVSNLLANDSDVDTDNANLTVSAISDPANGTAFISADKTTITYTPNAADFTDSFDYTVTDGTTTATATVNVTWNRPRSTSRTSWTCRH